MFHYLQLLNFDQNIPKTTLILETCGFLYGFHIHLQRHFAGEFQIRSVELANVGRGFVFDLWLLKRARNCAEGFVESLEVVWKKLFDAGTTRNHRLKARKTNNAKSIMHSF